MIAYVVFTKAKRGDWFFKFLHKEISHCYIMYVDKGLWVVLDQSTRGLIAFTRTDLADIISESIIVKVKCNKIERLISLNTCVSFVKRFIGIKSIFILTPYQLLKRIVKCSVKA